MQVAEAIKEFLHYCAVERQLSSNTLQAYACDLTDFSSWYRASHPASEITTETLKAYLDCMVVARKLAAATVRRRIACLRAFFRRVNERGLLEDPFSGWRLALPRRKRLPRALSREEVVSLLSRPASGGRTSVSLDLQLGLALRLMVVTGIRVGELCKLRVQDASPDGLALRVHGKGSRDRVVYVTDVASRADLTSLIAARRQHAGISTSIFINRAGSDLRPQSVRSGLRRAAENLGLTRRVTPHMLRHTAATLLIETGVDIRIVQRLLGHSSIATTELYTHVSDEALRTTLERANVLSTIRGRDAHTQSIL
jgi:integrase/recombinase XerD